MKSVITIILITVCVINGAPWLCQAEGTTRSSISVNTSANGDAEQSVHVRTIVNGKVVEDWHSTSSQPIYYSKTTESVSDEATIITTPAERTVDHRSTLVAILTRLTAILKLYVKLSQQ